MLPDEQIRAAGQLSRAISTLSGKIGRPLNLMEVCGTHTVAIFRHGIRSLLPPEGITLLSGPGCPVCVTATRDIDTALAYAAMADVVLATFGDMMRVPGSERSLYEAKARGADVRVVYSPLEALRVAKAEPEKKVLFFATGFETTSPLVAATLIEADRTGVANFYILPVHKLVPPALQALVGTPGLKVDGFILPGHVCTVLGTVPFEFLSADYRIPGVVTGFGALDILEGILMILMQVEGAAPRIAIQYKKVVREEGNPKAVETISRCFAPADAEWRGIGVLPLSGLVLKPGYAHRDARAVLGEVEVEARPDPKGCSCGSVLRGIMLPPDCPLFGKGCTPERPVGPCMVSAEGSCAAYYKYGGYGQK